MPLQATSGAASYDGFGGGPAAVPNYIEDVFSTWLYTGNGSTQTITNGIDLAGKGGLVWGKGRSAAYNHRLYDTNRITSGNPNPLCSNNNNQQFSSGDLSAFTGSGFNLRALAGDMNDTGATYASWTFRKQPKFFDVVTYTGNGVNGRTIAHALGAVPGCVVIKRTDSTGDWVVYHRSAGGQLLVLNSADAAGSLYTPGNFGNGSALVTPTDSVFSVANLLNTNGGTYVAYLFAHDAGGFGLTGTDNVISCGSFTTNGSGVATVSLGYEPQWVLVKRTDSTGAWAITDNMRGWVTGAAFNTSDDAVLFPNVSNAETTQGRGHPTATGFVYSDAASASYIYIAIRRGPMKTPTTGTSVFSPQNGRGATDGTANSNAWTTNFPVDMFIQTNKTNGINVVLDRLRGKSVTLQTSSTAAEGSATFFNFDDMDGIYGTTTNAANSDLCDWAFRRAPGFMDAVCYTGTGQTSGQSYNHNLGVAPELIISKRRNSTSDWVVATNFTATNFLYAELNSTYAPNGQFNYSTTYYTARPTATQVFPGNASGTGVLNATYVAYLFASCPGVSKVGSYTGNGTSLTVNCGFTGGARFVLIKRTDSTGDWVVFDSARGIVAGNDPFLELNTTAAEQTGQDAVDAASTGFIVNQTAENLNVNGASYIYLAIA